MSESSVFFENVLLKFILTNSDVREKTMPILNTELFSKKENVSIVNAIQKLTKKYGKFPTLAELRLDLSESNAFDQLNEIVNLDVSEFESEFLLDEIEEFIKKKLISNVNVNIAMALNDNENKLSDFPDILREAIAFSFDTKIGLEVFKEAERLYNHFHTRDKVIKTGIKLLDKYTDGGFHEKTLTLFLGQTNLGKSLILCSLAVYSLMQNKNVLYISCEMSENKMSERILQNVFDMSIENIRMIPKTRFLEKFSDIAKQYKSRFVMKEYPPSSINTNHIRNLLKELEVRSKFVPDIIYIDYIGIMLPTTKNNVDNTYVQMKKVSEEVRALSVEKEIPIVSALQTNRKGYGDTEIDLTNVSDSIGIASTGDIIIGITQSDVLKNQGKYCWIFLKNRYGPKDFRITVNVDYETMKIFDDEDTKEDPININNPHNKQKVVNDKSNEASNIIQTSMQSDYNSKFKKVIDYE